MRSRTLLAMLVLGGLGAWAAQLPRADDPTHFTPADQQAMLEVVRRAAASGRDAAFSPEAMPAKLLRSTGQPLILSAHQPGAEPLVAVAATGTLLEQLNEAARALRASGRLGHLPAVRFKLDLVRDPAPVDLTGLRGQPVLGIHGLRVRTPQEDLCLPATEALRLGLVDGGAFVRAALGRVKAPAGGLREVTVERFAAVSFMEGRPGGFGPPVALYRGMPLPGPVSRRALLAAVEAGGDWLLRFQKPDGSFGYLYDAAADKLAEGDDIVRQAGTAWSLAQAFGATRERRFGEGAYRALEWLLGQARTRGEMSWLESAGERPLGGAALAALALLEYRAAAGTRRFDPALRRLGRFLVFMQRDDGFFWTDYDPEGNRGFLPEGHVPLYAPGEAFLALVRLQRALPDAAWQRAAARAADFLATRRDEWLAAHDLEAVLPDAWTMMGLDELHALGLARRVHGDYCFFLARIALDEQERPETARWLDHVGAPRDLAGPPRVAPAAGRCEGLLAAWRLARRMGVGADETRCAVVLAARFLLAHQVDETNGYLLPNPARARGGFYSSYADHTVRIDFVQHCLSALIGLAEMLKEE